MPEEFKEYEEQYSEIVNYSGLSLEEISEICEEVKIYLDSYEYEVSIQNIVDIIRITSEIILSNKTAIESKTTSRDQDRVAIPIPLAIEMSIGKVLPIVEEYSEDNLKL